MCVLSIDCKCSTFLSFRLHGSCREAQLVALATIYYTYKKNEADDILSNLEIYVAQQERLSDHGLKERWPDVVMTLGQHEKVFGACPSQQDLAFYKAMNEDICIH